MENKQAEQNFSLPLSLRYNLGVADAVPSSKNLSQFLASNASDFTPSNNTIRIPVGSPAFLDLNHSLLQMDVTNTSGQVANLDSGADGLIRRIRVISSDGSTIEEIHEYGLLSSVLDQYTSSKGKQNVDSILKGAPKYNDETAEFSQVQSGAATATGAQAASATITGLSVSVENELADGTDNKTRVLFSGAGGIGYDQNQSDKLDNNSKRRYLFSLKLGLFNMMANRLLPPSTNFVLEIQLNDAANCIKTSATPSYKVQNVELHCPAIVINDASFNQRMAQRMAQGMVFKCNSYQHFVNTTASGTGSDVAQISARARSLKALMSIFRIQTNTVATAQYALSRRSIQYLDNYQYRIGSANYPVDRVNIKCRNTPTAGGTDATTLPIASDQADTNISEAYSQACRVMGHVNNPGADILIGKQAFAGSELLNGVGIASVDLSAYADSSVSSGIQTLNNMPISLEFTKNAACNAILQIDTFAIVEMSVVRDPSGNLQSFV